jgi:HTH-type transcriptional regulator/antitoxin HigA
LERLEIIFDAKRGTKQGNELELLGMLLEQYENEKIPIVLSNPLEATKFRMDQMRYNQNDLAKIVGFKSRARELLNRKRKLSLKMIRQLHSGSNIPTNNLLVRKHTIANTLSFVARTARKPDYSARSK